jgi:hypothetical protein
MAPLRGQKEKKKMKKSLLQVGDAVVFKFDGAKNDGFIAGLGTYQAAVSPKNEDGGPTVGSALSVPYKDILSLRG